MVVTAAVAVNAAVTVDITVEVIAAVAVAVAVAVTVTITVAIAATFGVTVTATVAFERGVPRRVSGPPRCARRGRDKRRGCGGGGGGDSIYISIIVPTQGPPTADARAETTLAPGRGGIG